MKRIKCVSIDIDGTLVREGGYYAKEITVDNITEIKEFCNKGGKIILATGRDLIETNKVFEHLCNNGISRESIPYLVCLNGSVIQNTLEEKMLFLEPFLMKIFVEMCVISWKEGVLIFFFWTEKTIVISEIPFFLELFI